MPETIDLMKALTDDLKRREIEQLSEWHELQARQLAKGLSDLGGSFIAREYAARQHEATARILRQLIVSQTPATSTDRETHGR